MVPDKMPDPLEVDQAKAFLSIVKINVLVLALN
jgi:hypothetical protein